MLVARPVLAAPLLLDFFNCTILWPFFNVSVVLLTELIKPLFVDPNKLLFGLNYNL